MDSTSASRGSGATNEANEANESNESRTASVKASEPPLRRGRRATAPVIGTVIAGKYLLERQLGRGGMGIVILARHLALRKHVALKFVTSSSHEVTARLLREARLVSAIKAEHVVRVLDVGMDSGDSGGGNPYVVMEYLEGASLARVLRERGPLPIDESVRLAIQICKGLDAAHALGIVHRDLKPSNLFITTTSSSSSSSADGDADLEHGLLKIVDFGVAKELVVARPDNEDDDDDDDDDGSTKSVDDGWTGDEEGSLTRSMTILGTPFYMSPEQVRSAKDVDARADLWSVGATLYEMLSGAPPFLAATSAGILAAVVADPPPSLRLKRPDIPCALEEIILKCLEKNPADRFANANALAKSLASSLCEDVDSSVNANATDDEPITATLSPKANAERPSARGPQRAIFSMLLLLVVGLVVFVASRSRSATSERKDTPTTTTVAAPRIAETTAAPSVVTTNADTAGSASASASAAAAALTPAPWSPAGVEIKKASASKPSSLRAAAASPPLASSSSSSPSPSPAVSFDLGAATEERH